MHQAVAIHPVPSVGPLNRIYNRNGNLTQNENSDLYEFDYANRLVKTNNKDANNQPIEVVFTYDCSGHKIQKTVTQTNMNTVIVDEHYYYSGEEVIAEYNAADVLLRSYVLGERIDIPVVVTENNFDFYFVYNTHRSVIAITNATGAIEEKYKFDAHGNFEILIDSQWVNNRYFYAVRDWEPEIKLYHNRARFYDPVNGFFIQRDPLGYVDGSNPYDYTSGNSVNYSDPLGLTESDDRIIVGKTDKLKDSAKAIENYVDGVIDAGRKAGLKGKELSKFVYENLGQNVKNSGITKTGKHGGSISERTKIAIDVENLLTLNNNDEIVRIPFKESKYSKIENNKILTTPLVGALPAYWTQATRDHTIAPTIKVNEVLIGTDKLEHIFQQGYWLYNEELSLDDQYKFSNFLEGFNLNTWGKMDITHVRASLANKEAYDANRERFETIFKKYASKPGISIYGVYGSGSSGVLSQADIVANLKGAEMFKLIETDPNYKFEFKNMDVNKLNEVNNPSSYSRAIKDKIK